MIFVATMLAAGALTACGGQGATSPSAPSSNAGAMIGLRRSQANAAAGDTVTVSLTMPDGYGAVLASLQFDRQGWRYLGQVPTSYLVLVETAGAEQGRVHLSASAPEGLPSSVVELQFVARRAMAADFTLQIHELVRRDFEIVPQAAVRVASATTAAAGPRGTARRLSPDDWVMLLSSGQEPAGVLLRPGDGRIFGDATENGVVSSGDLVVIANAAVGNLEVLRVDRDLPVAGNVAPLNLPGLGEDGDPLPPGQNADGTRAITSADQLLVSIFIVGNPVSVVGQPIPGRNIVLGLLPRVLLINDTLRNDRTFTADTIYEVRGTLVVGDVPVRLGARLSVTLRMRAGTRVEFEPSTRGRLVVATGSRLEALGTLLQPVVLTCTDGNAFPGCWGGVHVNGFALLNNSEQVGSPLKTGPGGTGTYGGVQQADSSGVLRFVRIEYAGRTTADGVTLAGLQLLGVGSRTVVENVQVHQALGDGIFVSGGTVRLRRIFLSDNRGSALAWNDGWTGRLQFAVMQQGSASGDAMRGSSGLIDPRSGPRSAPLISHVTVVGPAPTLPDVRTIRLGNGSGGRILNLIAQRSGSIGFDLDGDASCEFLAAYPDSSGVAASIFSVPSEAFAADTGDCLDEQAYGTATEQRNRLVDPLLLVPLRSLSLDIRPAENSPAATGDWLLPLDGFFDINARYIGAVPPATAARNAVPWYAGWTRGF